MSNRKRQRREYYNDYPVYKRKEGCLEKIKNTLMDILTALLVMLAIALIVGVVVIIFIFKQYIPLLLTIGGIILAFLLALLLLWLIFKIVSGISKFAYMMKMRSLEAKSRKIEIKEQELKLKQKQEAINTYQPIRVQNRQYEEPLVRSIPQLTQEVNENVIPNVPLKRTVYYKDVASQVKPGELIIGVRADGSIRIGEWEEYKVVLVLGGSSSGKTTTMTQLILGAVNGGGLIIPCDPHAHKPDSLFNKISYLKDALFPGTSFAIDHESILNNVLIVKQELEKRVNGGDCSIPIFLIIEELNRLQRDKLVSKTINQVLEALGQEGRGFNVFAIIGCQRVTYVSDIRKSVISYIVHRVDETESKLVIPHRYAKYTSELPTGISYVKDADGTTEGLLQVLVTLDDIQKSAIKLAKRKTSQFKTYNTYDIQQDNRSKARTTRHLPEKTKNLNSMTTDKLILPPTREKYTTLDLNKAVWKETDDLNDYSSQLDAIEAPKPEEIDDLNQSVQFPVTPQEKLDLLLKARENKKKRKL